jgi:hypothetical protein
MIDENLKDLPDIESVDAYSIEDDAKEENADEDGEGGEPQLPGSRRRVPTHCPDLLRGSYKAGREKSMGQSSLVSVGQG